jgi:predicted lipoprotein
MRTLVAALVLVGCSQPAATQEDTRRVLLQKLGEQIFLPQYVEFEQRAADVRATADALCESPSEETLGAARDAWWAARAPWKRNETVAFGPYATPDSYGAAIDFWPCRQESVDTVLAGTDAIEPALLGAAAKGLPAMEYLLWDPERDLVADSEPGSRRCEYLAAVGKDLADDATAIRAAWDPAEGDFLGELVEAGRGSKKYKSIEMSLGAVVNQMLTDLEAARDDKLGKPLGNTTEGMPLVEEVESRFSARSLEDLRDSLRGVEAVCFGANVEGAQSLASYLEGIGRDDIVPELRDALDASYAAIDAIPEPLTVSVVESPELVQGAIDSIKVVQVLISADVINAMGLMLTFTDADND